MAKVDLRWEAEGRQAAAPGKAGRTKIGQQIEKGTSRKAPESGALRERASRDSGIEPVASPDPQSAEEASLSCRLTAEAYLTSNLLAIKPGQP